MLSFFLTVINDSSVSIIFVEEERKKTRRDERSRK